MLNVALIGCGRIGTRHAKILGDYEVEGARLAAVADVITQRAKEFGKQYKIPFFTTNCRDDMLKVMVAAVRPDLFVFATPSGLHYEHIKQAYHLGVPILVEKPLTLALQDIDKIGKLNAQIDTQVGEVKQNRYNVAVQHLKNAILTDRLGKPRLASVRVLWSRDKDYYNDWHGKWSMSGGVLANQAIHHIDLLWWLLGDVKKVSASGVYSTYTEVETGIVAILEFENGCIATIEATTLTRPKDLEGSLCILGDKGTVELGGFAVNKIKTWQFKTEKPIDLSIRKSGENPPDVYGFGHIKLYEDIVKRFERGEDLPVSVAQARKSLEIVHAIYESMETGKPVVLNGDYQHSKLGQKRDRNLS